MNNSEFEKYLYPWQAEPWRQLQARRASLPHALLIHGPQYIGKQQLAMQFASGLLCLNASADGFACGVCRACTLIRAQSHPDFSVIQPEAEEANSGEDAERAPSRARKPSRDIRVEQIRDMQRWMGVGAHQGGWKIALVVPAEAMNRATANALLKTLEEPPPASLLILVSHRPAQLLPTVRSRCQRLPCRAPEQSAALHWLEQAGVAQAAERLALVGGLPLQALDPGPLQEIAAVLAELAASAVRASSSSGATNPSGAALDVARFSARLAAFPIASVIDLLHKWMCDLIAARNALAPRFFVKQAEALGRLASALDSERMFEFELQLRRARALADHPLNPRLVIDDLLIQWQGLGMARR